MEVEVFGRIGPRALAVALVALLVAPFAPPAPVWAVDAATITLSSPTGQVSPGLANVTWGDPFTIVATVDPDGPGGPELVTDGTVTFTSAATGPVTVPVANGTATTSWTLPESAVFTATYQDGSTYAAPPSGQYSLAVLPVPVTVGYTVVPPEPVFAEPVSLAVTVDPAVLTASEWTRADVGVGSINVFRVPSAGAEVQVGEYVIDAGQTTVALDRPAGVPMPAGANDIRVEFSGDMAYLPGGDVVVRFAPGQATGSLSVAQAPATVQVSGPTTVAAGALPTYTVSVGPAAAAYPPTGIVRLFDGLPATGTKIGEWLLTSAHAGTASIALASALAAGAHSLYATFDGATAAAEDPNRLDGTSTPLAVTVGKAAQATLSITGPATKTYGDAPFAPTTGGGSGTGEVTFTSTTPTVCTASASATVTIVTAGPCTITATKAADTNYEATTSAPFTVLIKASTTTTLTCTGGCTGTAPSYSTTYLTPVTFRATISPTSATGPVTFFDGTTEIGTDTISGPGRATITTSALSTGAHTITAVYAGDADYGSSTSSAVSLAVAQAAQATLTITGPTSATYGAADQPITTSGGSGTGAVTYDAGSSTACSIVDGQLHVLSGSGTCTITATKAADTNYNETTSAPFAVAIGKTPTTTTVACTANCSGTSPSHSTTYGTSVTFTATVVPTAATGTVAFKDGGTDIAGCLAVAASSGVAACTTSALSGGPHTITAVYSGDASHGSSISSAISLAVAKAAQATLSITGPATKTYGDAPFAPTTSGGSGTGEVTFTSTTPTVCTASASATVTIVTAGPCTITATKAADTNYEATTSAPFTVLIATAALTIAADPQSKTYGDPDPALSFRITSGSLVGSDAFTGALARAVGEDVPGGYAITQGTLTAGPSYSITYVAASLAITKAPLTGTANNKTRAYGVANPPLDVAYAGYKLGQTASTVGITGSPSCSTTAVTTSPVAAYSIVCGAGTLAANNYSFSAPFADGTLTVTKATSTTTIARSAASTTYGDTVTFTATVTPQAAGTATGSVEFRDGGALVATVALDANRQATLATSRLGAGSHSLAAVYAGDGNLAGSTSATPAVVTVAKATATVTADATSRLYGAADPTFGVTIAGLVNGETLATSGITGSPACSTVALPTSGVGGPYPITCRIGSLAAGNYAFAFLPGTLTIARAHLTVTADSHSRQYGLPNPPLTSRLNGFMLGENAASAGVSGAAACSTTATVTDGVGTAPVKCTAGTLQAPNYAFMTFVDGVLTIVPAQPAPVVTVNVNPAALSEPVTFTARVEWPVGAPAGTVTFFEDAADISGSLTLVDGAASFTTSTLPLGDHAITATYQPASGVTSFVAASSPAFTQSVGTTAVDVELTADRPTWETNVPIRFIALPRPRASRVTVPVTGQVVFAVDGRDRATVAIVGGTATYASPALSAGAHTVTARYVQDVAAQAFFTVGNQGTLGRTVVANTVSASGVGVSGSSVYPVADTFRDTVAIRGTRNERISVAISIYSPSGARVRTRSYARGSGAYSYTWNGRNSSGTILGAGRYRIVQVLSDAYGARRTYTSYVTLSRKRMYWYTKTIYVSPGPRKFSAPGDAVIQSRYSTTSSTPLVIDPAGAAYGGGWTGAGYQFTLPSASTYTSLSFQVRASWTGSTPPKIGLIPWNGGSWSSMWSTTRPRTAMGTSTTGYYSQTLTNLTGVRSGRYVRAAVDSFTSPTGYGATSFRYSIASVRLVVRYGILR